MLHIIVNRLKIEATELLVEVKPEFRAGFNCTVITNKKPAILLCASALRNPSQSIACGMTSHGMLWEDSTFTKGWCK
ncbi:hypothetical protein DPMN_187435 [Dreissena polymorpha]|uniref:Uncharacterized protein n=1 Tax=Dreissena polymorpha TaxID=45954 RepID=A0A9D4DS42_DREPO|nr:hypothetical protein DPMN_187435 [Dreissena polymorpha]